jgi:glycosyltransferase involved in cell wall biosynthesis
MSRPEPGLCGKYTSADDSSSEDALLVSVLTPSWNRGSYLSRVFDGLEAQTYTNIEWVVGNDGSTDETVDVVERLAKVSRFPITLVSASVRVGKSRIDNLLVGAASGSLIIWCDSDDELHADAIETMVRLWSAVPGERRNYMGVAARTEASDSDEEGGRCNAESATLSWGDVSDAASGDILILVRADLMKRNPFREVDYLIPESSVWGLFRDLKTIYVDRPLQRKNYGQPFALSFTGKMQYNRGRAYALGQNYATVKHKLSLIGEGQRAINFARYCFHGELGVTTAWRIWNGSWVSSSLLILGLPIALVIGMYDRIRGVVENTHSGFEIAKKVAVFRETRWAGKP